MDWQPIETAPHDGTRVIVWSRDWAGGSEIAEFDGFFDAWAESGDGALLIPGPTHWRPLPAPPKEQA